jgi:hypothetical protein
VIAITRAVTQHAAKYTLWHFPAAGPRGRVRGWNYALVYFAPWVSCKQLRRREPRLGGKITFPIHETSVIQGRKGNAALSPAKEHMRFLSSRYHARLHSCACLVEHEEPNRKSKLSARVCFTTKEYMINTSEETAKYYWTLASPLLIIRNRWLSIMLS